MKNRFAATVGIVLALSASLLGGCKTEDCEIGHGLI